MLQRISLSERDFHTGLDEYEIGQSASVCNWRRPMRDLKFGSLAIRQNRQNRDKRRGAVVRQLN